MAEALIALADEYWNAAMETSPLAATLLGDHRFDDQVPDLSAEGEAQANARFAALLARAETIAPEGLDRSARITRGMLISEITNRLLQSAAHGTELASDQMAGVHSQLMRVFPQTTVPEPEHAAMLLERFARMGTMLDQAAERFREGLAAEHTPAAINVQRSLSQLDGYLATPLESDLISAVTGPTDWDGEPAWRAEIARLMESSVRPAFDRYRAVLRDEILPNARPDDRPGLKWMTDGPAAYEKYIEIYTSLDISPEEIHEIGRHEVESLLPAEYEEIGGRALGISSFRDVLEALRRDQSLMYRDADQMFAMAQETIDRALAGVTDWFGVTPKAPCRLQAVPAAIAADVPVAYYFPPAPDGSRPGTYFVNTANAENRNMFEAESVAFHEAIPGHHFQLALAAELDGIPMFQRYATSTAFVEGWGLYTERLADEMGLYSSDVQRLGMLAADSWRGCRLVVDTGLHHLGWSRQRAIDYMTQHTPVREDDIAIEVDRYIGIPGQAVSYKMGQREIFRLRELAKSSLGDRFDIRGFHDACLTSGSVTLPILADLVDDWISDRAA